MQIGDIYIEALRLMFATGTEAIYAEPITADYGDGLVHARTLEEARRDEQYADYLLSMPGALNRALRDVEAKEAVPVVERRRWEADGLPFPQVTRLSPDTEELRLPEGIAVLLPYYIAGDLWKKEEPGLAGEWRNFYEAGMEQIIGKRDEGTVPASIETVFGDDWSDSTW